MRSSVLAIDGGVPVRKAPMPSWPAPSDEVAAQVADVVRSGRINYWTGTLTREFERLYAASLGRRHALAVANGTLALELALRAFGVGPGDEVVVPARTFIATAGAVVSAGATPVVSDVDTDSGTMTTETFEAACTPRTKAVIPVHLGGWPADMGPLLEAARTRGVTVIEDAAQAHGGSSGGLPVGNLGSDAAAFSFCNDKIISTGEGGMLLLDDDEAFERAWSYRDHGKSRRAAQQTGEGPWTFKWLVESFGTNWRFPEVCAPLGIDGLGRLPEWHRKRQENALRLASAIAGLPGLRVPLPPEGAGHAFYRLYAYVTPEELAPGWDRTGIARAIAAEGVPCFAGSCGEIYRERAFEALDSAPQARLPVASKLHETSLAFLVHPTLDSKCIDDTAAAITKVMRVAGR